MWRAIFLKKGLFMRKNLLKPMRFALSGVSSFLSGGGHLSLIPRPSPPSLTPKPARTDTSQHPLDTLISYLLFITSYLLSRSQ
jgi:hypothetical protein